MGSNATAVRGGRNCYSILDADRDLFHFGRCVADFQVLRKDQEGMACVVLSPSVNRFPGACLMELSRAVPPMYVQHAEWF